MAVTERFELSKGCPLHTFQACSFSHSDTSPDLGGRIPCYRGALIYRNTRPLANSFSMYFSHYGGLAARLASHDLVGTLPNRKRGLSPQP